MLDTAGSTGVRNELGELARIGEAKPGAHLPGPDTQVAPAAEQQARDSEFLPSLRRATQWPNLLRLNSTMAHTR